MPESERSILQRLLNTAPTTTPEPARPFRVGDRVRYGGYPAESTVDSLHENGKVLRVKYDDGTPASGFAECYTLIHPVDDGEPAWLTEQRKDLPRGWTMRVLGRDSSRGHDYASVEFIDADGDVVGAEDEIRRGATDSLWSVRGCVLAACKEDGRGNPYAAEPTVADGAAAPTKAPDLSLTNEAGFPTMPPRHACVAAACDGRDDECKHKLQDIYTEQPSAPKPPPRDDVAQYLASRKEPAEPEHVYREGDRVVVLRYEADPPFIATVGDASDQDYVGVWWTDWKGRQEDDSYAQDELRPATPRELARGR